MKWATRKGVKFDRSACAWLVLRHIDPEPEFAYLDADAMPAAIEAGSRPFHNISYAGPGSRSRTSFEELLAEYKLQGDSALLLMGNMIHSAEIGAESSGQNDQLRAIAMGMNALVHSDQDMVDRMLPVYDALYAYCKRKAEGRDKWASLEPGWGQQGSDARDTPVGP